MSGRMRTRDFVVMMVMKMIVMMGRALATGLCGGILLSPYGIEILVVLEAG